MNPTNNPIALRSKKEITETLLKLMRTTPYSEISVKLILLESKLSRKTFYRNFTSKDDVLKSYINKQMLRYVQSLQEISYDNFIDVLNVVFPFCERNKEILKILNKNNLMNILFDTANEFIPYIHHKSQSKNIDKNCMTDYIISFNIGAVFNVINKWVKDDMVEPIENIKENLSFYIANVSKINLRRL